MGSERETIPSPALWTNTDLEKNTLNTQKWRGSSRSIPQGFKLMSKGRVGAEPRWSRGAHGAGSKRGKGCCLVEMGQAPSNYTKGQMQMGGDNMTSRCLGTAQCKNALTHTLKHLKGSPKPWWEIWDVLEPRSGQW